MRAAAAFLQSLLAAVPYGIHTVLTDNGIQFADLPKNRKGPTARFRGHLFDRVCLLHGIDHRLTKPNHPWTNGQVERMNRTIKEATVQRYHYDRHDQLRTHLDDFIAAYNFAKRLKTLGGLTVYEFICKCWQKEPGRFTLDPIHQMPGLNISSALRSGMASYVALDVREPIRASALPKRADLVFNLAAVHREPGHQPREYFETNLKDATNCL
jgi:hypothetical protein